MFRAPIIKTKNLLTYFNYFYLYSDRKLFITFLILNEFSCGKGAKTLVSKAANEYYVFKLRAVVFDTTSNKDVLSLLEVVWINTACMKTSL